MKGAGTRPRLSIVVPLYNEIHNVETLTDQLIGVLDGIGESWEILFVDDGSGDGTRAVLSELHRREPRVKVLYLSRNFGHQKALTAGLDHALGEAVITMDGDLQHPPGLIPDLVSRWVGGAFVVQAIRRSTADAGWLKRNLSHAFYALLRLVGEIEISPNCPDFRLLDRRAVEALRRLPERGRFLRSLTAWVGFPAATVEFDAPERYSGRSSYRIGRMVSLAVEGITSNSTLPLHLATAIGLALTLLSAVYLVYALFQRLITGAAVPGWTSLIVVMLFMGGFQMVSTGILGLYLASIFVEVKNRPHYIVADRDGIEISVSPCPELSDRGQILS